MRDGLSGLGGAGSALGVDAALANGAAQADKVASLANSARDMQSPERVAEAARQFESLLATMLVKEMRAGLEEGFFGSGPGADTFSSMLDENLGNELAKRPLFGMTELLGGMARARVEAAANAAANAGADAAANGAATDEVGA
ncbi:flagellar rod assembly protein/muramidase FlgJ [Planctomycetes bacterium Pla163]|uniref:Flagellar rod assembly protein/muramidase FlgJ n=1 Tax=Rohdeia mirabilis TaxID=2528008 RepID=A0A518D500_9BACT|nr:flagellar rod assembly protein/muramidase FlgJ [Planctomycetes bacterium Pla163]